MEVEFGFPKCRCFIHRCHSTIIQFQQATRIRAVNRIVPSVSVGIAVVGGIAPRATRIAAEEATLVGIVIASAAIVITGGETTALTGEQIRVACRRETADLVDVLSPAVPS